MGVFVFCLWICLVLLMSWLAEFVRFAWWVYLGLLFCFDDELGLGFGIWCASLVGFDGAMLAFAVLWFGI